MYSGVWIWDVVRGRPDRRRADLARTYTGDAAGFASEDRLTRLRVAGSFPSAAAPPPRAAEPTVAGMSFSVTVHRAAEGLEERRECPDLRAVEADRPLVHLGMMFG